MKQIIGILQIIVSVLLVVVVLLQQRGTGIGGAFGGGGGGEGSYSTRRGFEKTLFRSTVILAVLFFVLSLAIFLFD